MASKRDRFEIFKRDNFKCKYCGRTPPEVVLELDHIKPKSKGGLDSIHNYITACFDCNRGKGNKSLKSIPDSLIITIERAKEKRKQVLAYNRYLLRLKREFDNNILMLNIVLQKYYPNKSFSDTFVSHTLHYFCEHLLIVQIEKAIDLAAVKYPNNAEQLVKYFCGICWNWIKYPETRGW